MGEAQVESRFAEVLGKRLHYQFLNSEFDDGKVPMLIFLHEGLGSIPQWMGFPQELSNMAKMPALVYERYGFGQSSELVEKRDINYMHTEAWEFLPALIKKLNITNQLILIGHSDGASIALIYASKYSEKLAGIITEAAHVNVEDRTIEGIQKVTDKYEMQGSKLKRALQKFHGSKTKKMFYGWSETWLRKSFKDWNIEELLPEITCPMLIIQGKDDEYYSDEQVEIIASKVSGPAEALLIDNCGHSPHIQQREFVLNKMADFISEIA